MVRGGTETRVNKWIKAHEHICTYLGTHASDTEHPHIKGRKRRPTNLYVNISDETCSLQFLFEFWDFRDTQHWGRGEVERCRKKHRPSVPLIYTWRSQVRIWKSAPYWSSAFNIHEALSRGRRFEHSGPHTPDQFSLISIGFFPQSIDVAPPTKTCSQGHLEHMSGVRSWWVLPVPVCALGALGVERQGVWAASAPLWGSAGLAAS